MNVNPPAPPVEGSVRLITSLPMIREALTCGGAFAIAVKVQTKKGEIEYPYAVRKIAGGWEFVNAGNGKLWHVDSSFGGGPDFFQCDCPDQLYRSRKCKHVLALAALLKAIGAKE